MDIINNVFLNAIVVIIIFGCSLYFALLAYRQGRTSSPNRIFAVLSLAIGFWILLAYLPDVVFFRSIALIIAKLNYIVLIVVSFTVFIYPHYFPQRSEMNKYIKYLVLAVGFGLAIFTLFTNKIISGLDFYSWGASYKDGEFAGFFYLYMMAGSLSSVVQYLIRWRKFNSQDKRQIKFFIIGLAIFMLINIVMQSIVKPLITHTDELYKIGNYSAVFMIIFTGYAIIKYELFNIKVITTEIFTVVIWIVLFSRLLVSQSFPEVVINGLISLMFTFFGLLLVRSVINEVKQRELLQQLNEKLKELDKQKDEFVSMAAHELRSPLTAIKGYVSMVIEGDTGDIPEKARQYLADSMAVTDRLVRLVNNMLNVSRIEEGRIVYQMEETSLIHAVQEIFNSSRVEAERKGLEFKESIPNGLSDTVKVDPDRIREVVGNIVSNAIKFTEKGKVSIKMSNPKPGWVKVEVIDTGPGISKVEQVGLFQKFYRAESTAGKTFGTGLGLYITRLLIEKFGGKMSVESELDKGSNFWFELPVVERV